VFESRSLITQATAVHVRPRRLLALIPKRPHQCTGGSFGLAMKVRSADPYCLIATLPPVFLSPVPSPMSPTPENYDHPDSSGQAPLDLGSGSGGGLWVSCEGGTRVALFALQV